MKLRAITVYKPCESDILSAKRKIVRIIKSQVHQDEKEHREGWAITDSNDTTTIVYQGETLGQLQHLKKDEEIIGYKFIPSNNMNQ